MASYKETTMLLPLDDKRTFGEMDWQYLTIHNTANRVSAKSEAMYVHSGKSEVTYHFAIDDRECVQIQRLNLSCWHAGDGRGSGNTKSVAIEICYSLDKGDSRYPVAEDNAAHKAAKLLLSKGFGIDRLRKHQDWSGKYCPHRMLDNRGWEPFKAKVSRYMEEIKKKQNKSTTKPKPVAKSLVIAYWSDGDLANAQALFNAVSFGTLVKTEDTTSYKDSYVVQVGGHPIKGSTKQVFGSDRLVTLEKVSKVSKELLELKKKGVIK